MDLQAQDRCHRIGQTKPVLVLRLVTAGTVDQCMVERAAAKRKLEKIIIKNGKRRYYSLAYFHVCGYLVDSEYHWFVPRSVQGRVSGATDFEAGCDRSKRLARTSPIY